MLHSNNNRTASPTGFHSLVKTSFSSASALGVEAAVNSRCKSHGHAWRLAANTIAEFIKFHLAVNLHTLHIFGADTGYK